MPVDDATVTRTLRFLPAIVADMVRLQRLSGCRPGEICLVRPGDIDTSHKTWSYRPQSHKTEPQDRERVIFLGSQGQAIPQPYLAREQTSYCFSSAEADIGYRMSPCHSDRDPPWRSQFGPRHSSLNGDPVRSTY